MKKNILIFAFLSVFLYPGFLPALESTVVDESAASSGITDPMPAENPSALATAPKNKVQKEMTELFLFQDIPVVETASKKIQSIAQATSIVTVITKEDIERWGVRTVYELLKRVPGFFSTAQATWPLVGSRGMLADGNDHILFLVDGHPQNSIIGQGYQQQDLLPVLEKVEKVEIIRGPGSVLWGSNAVWGIINVITKDGSYEGKNKVTTGYGHGDGMYNANYSFSFGLDEKSKGMISASYWQSNGYDRPGKTGPGAAWSKIDAETVKGNVEFPWGEDGAWPPLDKQREGYELYAKLDLGNNRLLGRIVESNIVYPWDTWQNKPGGDLTMRKAYIEYQNKIQPDKNLYIANTVSGDLLLQNRFPSNDSVFKDQGNIEDNTLQDQTNEELAFTVESLANWKIIENNELKMGIKASRTKIGPNRDTRFNSYLNNQELYNTVTAKGLLPAQNVYMGVEPGFDNNAAIYMEDLWQLDSTTVFAGVRFDYNDFRETKGVFLPRGGVIQQLGENLTAKYVLNTGYLRPNATYSKTVGIIVDTTRGPSQDLLRVTNSEEIMSHDLQVYWQQGKNYAAVTGYYTQIKNYISFDANNTPQGYKNLGDATTLGVEAETKYHVIENLAVYGNYSLAIAKLKETLHRGAITNDQNIFLNYPTHLFNAGLDYVFDIQNTLNVNLNGWANMAYVKPLGEAETYGEFSTLPGEYYLDVNFKTRKVLGTPVDLTLFVMNVLDNTNKLGMVVNNGVYYPRGRSLGGEFSIAW